MIHSRSTFSLIGERYLDTAVPAAELGEIQAELARRRIVGPVRWLLEYLAASALWWNVVWWDEFHLGGRDVAFGWASNVVLWAFVGAVARAWLGVWPAALAVLLLHAVTLRAGLRLARRHRPEA